MMVLRIKLTFLLIFPFFILCESKYGYVKWSSGNAEVLISNKYEEIPKVHVAKATYSNEINSTGWAFLELHTSPDVSDEKQAYAAGFLEGFLTRDLIWMHWQNSLKGYCYNKTVLCGLIEEFVDKNEEYIAVMIKSNPSSAYWYQVKLYYIQLEGMAAGYNKATRNAHEWLTIRDIKWINMLGDLDELAIAVSSPKDSPDGLLFGEHCSGLVKLLPDLSDLYTSHVTWNSYQSMLRFQKMYVLNYRMSPNDERPLPGRRMSFTSYPALAQSGDDFYILSSGLVAAETTIGNSNRTLFNYVQPTGQLFEYVRAMVANRLATNGKEWVELFRMHNSGTYNNQWYIVDYNKFKAKGPQSSGRIEPGLLWVVEQLPGYTEVADLTELLKEASYFPSYNIPYFPRVFNMSGGNENVATFGDWFGYSTSPRAQMFKAKQAEIHSLQDMFSTMRYNDYRHDARSRCDCRPPRNAANAISARSDLNPANGTYPFRALGHRSHGATDAKVTSAELRKTFQFLSVSSPTFNVSRGIPPFQWSKFDMGKKISHIGHPDLWMFPPILHNWQWG